MSRPKYRVVKFIVPALAIFSSGCAVDTKEDHDSWTVARCVLKLLPPSYYTSNENSKISGLELGPAEIAKFSREAPEGLADALREEVKKLWPDKTKFQRSLGRHVEESASDFAFNLARNLSNRFQLGACGVRNDIDMTMVTAVSDKVSGIFRGNGIYEAIPMGPPGRAYLVMMAAGATMNGYPNALEALSGTR